MKVAEMRGEGKGLGSARLSLHEVVSKSSAENVWRFFPQGSEVGVQCDATVEFGRYTFLNRDFHHAAISCAVTTPKGVP